MSSITAEIIQVCEALPPDKQTELVDFARFLQQQAGDAEWERILAARRTYPKLEEFAADALREGAAEPLDPSKL